MHNLTPNIFNKLNVHLETLVLFTVLRHAEIAFGIVLCHVSCLCLRFAWPFVVINRKVYSAEFK